MSSSARRVSWTHAPTRHGASWEASGPWRVTLAPDFLALDTTRYSSRDDFMRRLEVVLQSLKDHVDPKVVDRLGVRYIDQVAGQNLTDLPQLVRPEVAGILGSPLAEHARHAISENVFVLPEDEGQVTVRWGLLPAQSTVDPGGLDPIDEPSWILDTDAFQSFPAGSRELSVNSVVEQARGFAERIYSILPLGGNGRVFPALRSVSHDPPTRAARVSCPRRNDFLVRSRRWA